MATQNDRRILNRVIAGRDQQNRPAWPDAPYAGRIPKNADNRPSSLEDEGHIVEWPTRRFQGPGEPIYLTDILVREQRIWLVLNGTPLLAMLALPRDIEALALGFLVSEGLWRDRHRLPEIRFDPAASQVECRGDFPQHAIDAIRGSRTVGPGCGSSGTARDLWLLSECAPLRSKLSVLASQMADLGRDFRRRGDLYRRTGGVHACALAVADRVVLFAEDVGRHNAFDKVAGMALQRELDMSNCIALTTGRISVDIVAKAVAHGVPILASLSAPTAMGARWSRHFGLTLIGFLRGRRMNVYSGYDRVVAVGTEDGPEGTGRRSDEERDRQGI